MRARAVTAEGLRHGRDKTDLASAVVVYVALGDPTDEFTRWHDAPQRPSIAISDVHVLDQADDDASAAKVLEQFQEGVVIDATLNDCTYLYRRQSRTFGGLDPGQHLGQSVKTAVHATEGRRIERIEAHGDTSQSVRLELRPSALICGRLS